MSVAAEGERHRIKSLDHTQNTPGGIVPNHNPMFVRGADLYVIEDSGVFGPAVWATNIVDGDGPVVNGRATDSGTQSVEFRFIFRDVTLFDGAAGRPRMADDGLLTFRPAPDACGVASVIVELLDSGTPDCIPGTNAAGTVFSCPQSCVPTDCHVSTQVEFFIEVICINDAPSYSNLGDHTSTEGDGAIVVQNWAYDIRKGSNDEQNQLLTFTVTNSNQNLFSQQPTVRWDNNNPTVANLLYTAAPGQCGQSTVTVALRDNGGVSNGGIDTAFPNQIFTITVRCTNQSPSFQCGSDVNILEDNGPFQFPNWAKGISSGDQTQQNMFFDLVFADPTQSSLFAVQPSLDPVSGELTFTAKKDVNTFNTVVRMYVRLRDSSGASSCVQLTDCCVLRINIEPVNDPPTFSCGPDINICEDLVNLPVAPTPPIYTDGNMWATNIDIGASNEAAEGQTIQFLLEVDPPTDASSSGGLFAKGPAIDQYGTLTFELKPHAFGRTGIRVTLRDSGSNVAPNSNSGPTCEFVINVEPVADAPSFQIQSLGTDEPLIVTEDSPSSVTTFNTFITQLSRGPFEGSDFVEFVVTNDNPELFTENGQPTVALGTVSTAGLQFTLSPNRCGQAWLTITAIDSGSTSLEMCRGRGENSFSVRQQVKVDCRNDIPTFDLSCGLSCEYTICEDQYVDNVGQFVVTNLISNPSVGGGPDERTVQGLNYIVTTDNEQLFSQLPGGFPSVSPAGRLSLRTRPNGNGQAVISVVAFDNGEPPASSIRRDISLVVLPTYDPPEFSVRYSTITVPECTTPNMMYDDQCQVPLLFSQPGNIPEGCQHLFAGMVYDVTTVQQQAGQVLNFEVQLTNAAVRDFFLIEPAIDSTSGLLSFTTKVGVSTSVDIDMVIIGTFGTPQAQDVCSNVINQARTEAIKLRITPINWNPCFRCGSSITVAEDSGQKLVLAHATNITAGPSNEHFDQPLVFRLTASNPELFQELPTIDSSTGNLYFVPAADRCGSTEVMILLDDGQTSDNTATCKISIVITAVNDVPEFTNAGDVLVNEDSGLVCTPWVHSDTAGQFEDATTMQDACDIQTISYSVEVVDNPNDLFLEPPSIQSDNGNMCFRTRDDVCGVATIRVTLTDSRGLSAPPALSEIQIYCLNDAPSFRPGTDIIICEDSGPYVGTQWCSDAVSGPRNELTQRLRFTLESDSPELFLVQPYVDVDCNIFFTPSPDSFGITTVTVDLCDDGQGVNPHQNCAERSQFSIAVTPINDAPYFIPGGDITVLEDSGSQVFPAWASSIRQAISPSTETNQALVFSTVTDNNNLFSRLPLLNPKTGDLTFELALDMNGRAEVTACLQDDGGVSPIGQTSQCPLGVNVFCKLFFIVVRPCNDAPRFFGARSVEVEEDSGRKTIASWLSGLSTGPDDERLQSFISAKVITPETRKNLFSELPRVSTETGDLTFTPASNQHGTVELTVELRDDGGTADGCVDTSLFVFMLTILPINDIPTFSSGAELISVPEDSGLYSQPWASTIRAGGLDLQEDLQQALTFDVNNDNPGLFSQQPAVDVGTGVLTFIPTENQFGIATVSISLYDGGGDNSRSPVVQFKIQIRPVNDPPTFTIGPDLNVLEGSQKTYCEPAWASMITPGPLEQGQLVFFTVAVRTLTGGGEIDNNYLSESVQATINGITGELCITLINKLAGVLLLDVTASDNGDNVDQGRSISDTRTFQVFLQPVNDPPFFVSPPTVTVFEDASSPVLFPGFATQINTGGLDDFELMQQLTFSVIPPNDAQRQVLLTQPKISPVSGDLSFSLSPNSNGEVIFRIILEDSGGRDNGGIDRYERAFSIRVVAVNDKPSFRPGALEISVREDQGPVLIQNWATEVRPGPQDEISQMLTFVVSQSFGLLFARPPNIDPVTGDFSFEVYPDVTASSVDLTVVLIDGGGGDDTSTPVIVRLTITPVNDPPTYKPGPSVIMVEKPLTDTTETSFSQIWATEIAGGPSDEDHVVTFTVQVSQPVLFIRQPILGSDGTLSFSIRSGVEGNSSCTVFAVDSEGLQAAPFTFVIVVTPAPPAVLRVIMDIDFSFFSSDTFRSVVAGYMQIPSSRVLLLRSNPGSTVVDFSFQERVAGDTTSKTSAELTTQFIQAAGKNGDQRLKTDLQLLDMYPVSSALPEPSPGNKSQDSVKSGSSSLSGTWIAVIVVLVFVLIAAVAVGVWYWKRRQRRRNEARENEARYAASGAPVASIIRSVQPEYGDVHHLKSSAQVDPDFELQSNINRVRSEMIAGTTLNNEINENPLNNHFANPLPSNPTTTTQSANDVLIIDQYSERSDSTGSIIILEQSPMRDASLG